nr:hypothetical protein [Tanacetum cinerariifolium]
MQERLYLNKTQGASTPEEVKRMQNLPYASAVGSIVYAVRCTRPDVAFAQNITSRFQQNPGEPHWTAVKNILNDDIKSQTGYVFVLNGGAMDWKSPKQSTTAMSATEAKYIVALEAAMEAVWIRKFILWLGIVPTINEPIKMFCNNSAALFIANEPKRDHTLILVVSRGVIHARIFKTVVRLLLKGSYFDPSGFAWCYTCAYIQDGGSFIAKSGHLDLLDLLKGWIYDTGASDHMTPVEGNVFDPYQLKIKPHIRLPNGDNSVISHVGKVKLNNGTLLKDVLVVPSFKLPSSVIGNVTPYEIFLKKPDYTSLRVLGCLAMVSNPLRTANKFDPRVNFKEAAADPSWCAAIDVELKALEKMGNRQRRGIDYQETFAPIAKMVTVRSLLATVAVKGWFTCQMDVSNAFLYGNLSKEVYMKPPLGYTSKGHNHKYTKELLKEGRVLNNKPFKLLIKPNLKLQADVGTPLQDPKVYRRFIGKLIYLTATRPDRCYTVKLLSQFIQSPTSVHICSIKGLCDSEWASCPMTKRSTTEYRAMAMTRCVVTWLVNLFKDLGIKDMEPFDLFCDNQGALYIAANPVFHGRTKHIKVDCHYVRD